MSINITTPRLLVRQLMDRDTWTYTYLLVDPQTQLGVLIDPVREQMERDLSLIRELGVELLYVLETHVHADHVTSAGMIRQQTEARIVYSAAAEVKAIDVAVNDGDAIEFGNFSIRAITTPGHTSGCVSYYVDGMVFTGDALLIHGCGRTDFQQGNAATLYHSVTQKLFTLPDDTIVYPAHDYKGRTASSIGEEKRWNPRLGNDRSEAEFIEIMADLNLDLPKKINEAVPANLETGISFDPKRYLHEAFTMSDLHSAWESLPQDEVIVDTRTEEEYQDGHVPGALNIPFGEEDKHAEELKGYRKVYLYCRSGRRAQTVLADLSIMGLDNLTCVGHSGMPEWEQAGYPTES